MKHLLIAFGTRPEIIKLAPVIRALDGEFKVTVLHTGQHRELAEPLFSLFDIHPDVKLDIMQPGQDLFELTASLLPKLKRVLDKVNPDLVMVQGDTTTSYLTALAAFYRKIPVWHVEAGLRSHNPYYPFPEEMNRKQITHLAHFHLAPTELNKSNLLNEGIDEKYISVTGNTVNDALNFIRHSDNFALTIPEILDQIKPEQKVMVLTAHRRENHGEPLLQVFEAVHQLLDLYSDLVVIFPAHPNPKVQEAFQKAGFRNHRFIKIEPLDYLPFLHVLERADIILSDSGGIQEEAAALGKKVLVLRNETERQELIEAGIGELVGTDPEKIISRTRHILESDESVEVSTLFGDGNAAQKIKNVLKNQL